MGLGSTGGLDPFRAPVATRRAGSVMARELVVVAGIVVGVEATCWVGGPVLEVELRDVTGTICLAFLGRRSIGGVELGALVTAGGTVGRRRGRALILNPLVWLAERRKDGVEGARDQGWGAVDIPGVPVHQGTSGDHG